MYVLRIVLKIRGKVLQIDTKRIKATVVSKNTNFTFCREKEQIINRNIKN